MMDVDVVLNNVLSSRLHHRATPRLPFSDAYPQPDVEIRSRHEPDTTFLPASRRRSATGADNRRTIASISSLFFFCCFLSGEKRTVVLDLLCRLDLAATLAAGAKTGCRAASKPRRIMSDVRRRRAFDAAADERPPGDEDTPISSVGSGNISSRYTPLSKRCNTNFERDSRSGHSCRMLRRSANFWLRGFSGMLAATSLFPCCCDSVRRSRPEEDIDEITNDIIRTIPKNLSLYNCCIPLLEGLPDRKKDLFV